MDDRVFLEAPPPYTAVSAVSANPANSHGLELNSLTSHLQNHVLSLPDRIRAIQRARRAEQTLNDALLLDYIVPIVEEFLADLGARPTPIPVATLTLVPGAAVPQNAALSGLEDMKRRGELCRVSRITINSTGKDSKSSSEILNSQNTGDDQSWTSGQEFTDWGRFGESSSLVDDGAKKAKTLWWHDEEMAHRLAGYLQPKKEPVEVNSVVQAVVEHRIPQKKEKKGWGWGRRTGIQKTPEVPIPSPVEPNAATAKQGEREQKAAEMTVSAQEVAFRQENDFGILESVRGWGIIVAVKVRT
ncbi:hypothetical protein GGS26DRAFT_30073 [Hypomontagnella submonticulosa]|nr:hypothetical protein GGS26DRAFT_30073 [Hypomontagnella submonticulosa]